MIANKIKNLWGNKSQSSKILISNVFGSFIIRGIGILISFFTTPAFLRYFDDQAILGIWFTILSVLNWILNFDMGIGNGLRNKLVSVLAHKEYDKAKKYISSAYILLGLISILCIVISFGGISLVNWNTFFNISSDVLTNTQLILFVRIIICSVFIQLWLKLITSILYALQKTALSNSLLIITNIILLLYVSLFKQETSYENLIRLSIVYSIAVNAPLLIATFMTFNKHLKNERPSLKDYNPFYARDIFGLGGKFFIIQLCLLFISSTNPLLITWFYNSESVVDYQIYYKTFSLSLLIFNIILQPIWSAVTKAYNQNDFRWIKSLHKKIMITALLITLALFMFNIFYQPFVNLWLGSESINVNLVTGFKFSLLFGVNMLINASTIIANGIGKIEVQLKYTLFGALLKVPVTLLLVNINSSWETIIDANIIILLPLLVMQTVDILKLFNSKDFQK